MSMSHTDIAKPKESGTPAVEQSQWGQGFLAREPVTHAFWVLFCQCVWAALLHQVKATATNDLVPLNFLLQTPKGYPEVVC